MLKPNHGVFSAASTATVSSSTVSLLSADLQPDPTVRPGTARNHDFATGIPPYRARFGRSRPLVAVVGENSASELTDFVIPYGVLARSAVADTVTVSTQPGPITMRPALRIQPDASIAEFDARNPEGADYVIVPAIVRREDPALQRWLVAQHAKGGTIVSICDGALVLAHCGLLDGRRATAHWATEGLRARRYRDTHWVRNVRYVADGRVISSAGISASIPLSIALVEAVAGRARASALAAELGVSDWSPVHNSDVFRPRFGVNLMALLRVHCSNRFLHAKQQLGVPVAAGVDEIALAFMADAYSRTGRSQALALSASEAPVRTRHGLRVIPDRVIGGADAVTRILPNIDATAPASALDRALSAIASEFGRSTAYGVALDFEYPGFSQ
jgi:putative intracellular protease/amidase